MSRFAHLYRTQRWRRISERQRRLEPLCRMCKAIGKVTVANVCDHVNGHPPDETEEQFWAGPFASLCVEHHNSAKARMERGGKPEPGCDANGVPLDPLHGWHRD